MAQFKVMHGGKIQSEETVNTSGEAKAMIKGIFAGLLGFGSHTQSSVHIESTNKAVLSAIVQELQVKKASGKWVIVINYYSNEATWREAGEVIGAITGSSLGLCGGVVVSHLIVAGLAASTPPGMIILGIIGAFVIFGAIIGRTTCGEIGAALGGQKKRLVVDIEVKPNGVVLRSVSTVAHNASSV